MIDESDESHSDELTGSTGGSDLREETYELTASEVSDLQYRAAMVSALGQSFGGKRDIYETFGWDKSPDIEEFYASYRRNPYAKAVVDNPAKATWRNSPLISDEESAGADESTAFEGDVQEIVDDQRLWHYCRRADQLAGIGEYGVLMIGFADGQDFIQPVDASELSGPSDVSWLRPFSQLSIESIRFGDQGSGRWGKPEYYRLDLATEDDSGFTFPDQKVWVHHTRIIHIADGLLDDEVRGTPRQEPVYNNLLDIEKTYGAAAELAYRGSDKGVHANVDPEYQLDDDGKQDLGNQLERWQHDLQPFIRTQGVDIENIGGETFDPSHVVSVLVEAISAATGQPQSVIKGNETGERATTQDLKEWYGVISERQEQFAEHVLVRALIDRLLEFGVISQTSGKGYDVEWLALAEESEKETSEVQVNRSKVAKNLAPHTPDLGSAEWVEFVEEGEIPEPEPASNIEPMDREREDGTAPDGDQPDVGSSEGPEPEGDGTAVQEVATDGGEDQ